MNSMAIVACEFHLRQSASKLFLGSSKSILEMATGPLEKRDFVDSTQALKELAQHIKVNKEADK